MADNLRQPQGNEFEQLLEKGLNLLQSPDAGGWTDHNLHDPGITVLEALAFAMSELQMKGETDMQDLYAPFIAATSGTPLLHGKKTLLGQALTRADYRRLLSGIENVRSAELVQDVCPTGLKGLYRLLLELGKVKAGDLNSNIISLPRDDTHGNQVSGDFAFPYWEEAKHYTGITVPSDLPTGGQSVFLIKLKSDTDEIPVYVRLYEPLSISEILLKEVLEQKVLPEIQERWAEVDKKQKSVLHCLNSHRNLCEDISSVQLARTQEIAISCDLLISSGAEPKRVLRAVFQQLDLFFTPPRRTFTESELITAGFGVDAIYEGPGTETVFYYPGESERPPAESLKVSDLIGLIMNSNEKEIIAIEEFGIKNYVNNHQVNSLERNCLRLVDPVLYKPRFSPNKSTVRIFQNGILLGKMDDKDIHTNTPDSIYRTPVMQGNKPSLPVENLGSYHSIQHDLPQVYALQTGGLPEQASRERKAQRLQLKAYLALFDQVLANHAKMVSDFPLLFPPDPDNKAVYFTQSVADLIPDSEMVLENTYSHQILEENSSRKGRFLDYLLATLGYNPADFYHAHSNKHLFLRYYPLLSGQRGKAFNYEVDRKWPDFNNFEIDETNVSGIELKLAIMLGMEKEELILVEHILLRPESDTKITEDVFSYQVSLIFCEPGQTKNKYTESSLLEYKKNAERLISLEMPAHIVWKAFWLTDFNKFKKLYSNYFKTLYSKKPKVRQEILYQISKLYQSAASAGSPPYNIQT